MKNMYGKQVLGIERCTFLIDEDSILPRFLNGAKVKVKGHCQAILDKIASL
jgi:peroxiredoxin Q/BCP